MPPKATARFIAPMRLLRTDALPKDAGLPDETVLDGEVIALDGLLNQRAPCLARAVEGGTRPFSRM
jgi:hypothetical protein